MCGPPRRYAVTRRYAARQNERVILPEPDAVAAKRAFRREVLARRRAVPAAERAAADAALLGHLLTELTEPTEPTVTTVAAYVPVGAEPGGPGLPDALRAAGLIVLLPVLQPDGALDWARYTGELTDGPHGLREPTGPRLGQAAVAGADAVVVPAVAVDRRGVRLGRGGGSYDRALARVAPGVSVTALLYDGELVDLLPAEPHDRHVGAVVTPGGVRLLP
ncbi:MAG: 5-formyltetrahydrofolate cyclo-ligase [Mycobacterium sp.]|nr:5-formyltetrahydrofolate cyclo-ligase [Mycobacterium sp.]